MHEKPALTRLLIACHLEQQQRFQYAEFERSMLLVEMTGLVKCMLPELTWI